jgi:hypothetical protein
VLLKFEGRFDRGDEEERPSFVRSAVYNGQGEVEMEQVRRDTF